MIKNLKDVMKLTEDECRQYLIKQRWDGVPTCPYCGCQKSYRIENGKRFKCANKECYKKYSVTVGTIFEASNIPLTTWFAAMYLIASHKKGISSLQLSRDLSVTQKTAWFMLHRIRESLREKNSFLLSGTVEADETYMGRKYRSDFKGIPEDEVTQNMKDRHKGKGLVLGMAQRDGKVVTKVMPEINVEQIRESIKQTVTEGSNLYTDQSYIYRGGLDNYNRASVRHTMPKPQWVIGNAHTNTIEGFWGVMKRGIYGIYHQVSFKHLQRYCDEFTYRYNSRKIKDGERFVLALQGLTGRLTYKQLVNGEGKKD